MAYNGSHQNSDTEDFLAKTELEGESKDNKNLENVDDWHNGHVNVQNEIWRGKKLREKKPKVDVTEKEYNVPNIHFFECFVKKPRVRKGHLEIFKNNTSQRAPRSKCPCTRSTSAASSYWAINRLSRTTIQTKAKKGKRCPMRIAELAVPTKRQCIETWRNKSDVLPEFMVERLKQHVMDQRPIVKIPEAIYCFQNGKRVSSKKCLSSKREPKETLKSSNHMDARMLSIVFAHEVAKRLARRINLTMNSDLEKLSAIVSNDITKIMSKCQCTTTKGRQYKAIQSDVSNKITVWITGILDDLSIKLLEEDLRVKTETAALLKTMLDFSERIVTIIEPIRIEQANYMKSTDLEDEEGPVLDFIDDVVVTVMNICEPPQLHIDTDSNLSGSTKYVLLGEESEKPVETFDSAGDKMSQLEEIFISETSSRVLTEQTDDGNENLTDSEHLRNEISNIIDNITKESGDDMSNGSGDDIENGSIDDENEENSIEAEMEHNTNNENNEGISPEAGIEHDVNDETLPEAEKKQDDDNNEGISSEAGIEHDLNVENNHEILPKAEKKQDDENNEGISSEAGIEQDLNVEDNDEILPETEKKQDDENYEGISSEAGIEDDLNVEDNDEILPETEKKQDDENNEGISSEAGIEHDLNDNNNDEILPEAEKKQDDDNNEGISSEAGIEHDLNVENNHEILPKAEKKQDDENNEGISSEAGIEDDLNVEDNDEILPETEKKQDDENNEGISSEAGIEHDLNDNYNDEILPEAEKKQDDENNEGISSEAGIEHDLNDEILPEAEKKQDDENNEGISSEARIEHDLNDDVLPETDKQQDLNDEILPEAEKQQDIKDENNLGISPKAGIEHDTNDENLDQIVDNGPNVDQNDETSDNAAETHTNVSERFEIFTDDSDDDENSKKVMFPKKDLVNPDNPADQNKTSTAEEPAPEPDEHKRAHWNPPTNKFNIIFAEPNQNLLSDADESWPADLGDRPMLKVSESASKSISSLGRIAEIYEMQMSPEDEDSMTDKGTGDTILQVNNIMEKLDNTFVTEKHYTASQPSEPLIKVYIETSTPEPSETQVDSKILDEKDMGKTITVPKPCDDRPVDESCKPEEYQTDSGESELIRTESTTDRTEDDEILSHKSQSRVDYGWKVHPKTAPSWVISWGQGRGEPSEDSIPIQIRPTKVTEIELRKWCKELEKAFTNLDMWSNWISATCKEGLFVLQQKELNCPVLAQKGAINWMRLKRNVHKDALLWTKLYQRTDKKFKSLKKKYNNIEFSSNKMSSVLNRTIFEKMREFEELSARLHKMIVAAEYSAMCTCDKAKPRHHSNKQYLGYRTK